MAILHGFGGLVSILRANESRRINGHWRLKMAYGVTEVLLAEAVAVIAIWMGRPEAAVYVYAAGLIYSAILRIAQAFRHTDIVYIQ